MKLTDEQRRDIDRMAADYTTKEIAAKLGLPACTVGMWIGQRRRNAKRIKEIPLSWRDTDLDANLEDLEHLL